MSVIETILVFAGIPLGIIALLAASVYGKSMTHSHSRYRPGKPWSFPAAWYLPNRIGPPNEAHAATAAKQLSGDGTGPAAGLSVGGATGEW